MQYQNNICVGLVAVSASRLVKLIYWHTSCCRHVSCLQHSLSICQVFCL